MPGSFLSRQSRLGATAGSGTVKARPAFDLGQHGRTDVANAVTERFNSLFDGQPNLSVTERAVYVVAGLGLAAAGAKPRPNPLLNVAAILGGAFLAWRGYVGQCPVKAYLAAHEETGRDARIAARH
jgi:hypothetical protein